MKKIILVVLLIVTYNISAQIKIGNNPQTLDGSSLLELESSSKVLVISKMSEDEMLALTPLQGAIAYNTDASCIFYFDGDSWKNLCSSVSSDIIAWGTITGVLTEQDDLVAEFQNYVDLVSVQSIGGEKTLTDKLTVNTGDINAQIAEFVGRVKGVDGTSPEDFVTKAQLDNISNGSHFGTEGSIYFADSDLGGPTENPNNLFWDNSNKQLRIGEFTDLMQFGSFSDNLSTVNIQGSVSKPVHQATTLTEEHYTTIISWSTYITLPDPATCYGRVYVVKIRPNVRVQIRGYTGYLDSASVRRLEFPSGEVTQLQSNGFNWEQIN